MNHVRHVYTVLKTHRRLRLPGTVKKADAISVLADDPAPLIKDGYATYDTISVPGRKGITHFTGYNPMQMDVPIQFEAYAWGDGSQIESDIRTLERMAGRGLYAGNAVGPPSVVRLSVTDNRGRVVPLIPTSYQWTSKTQNAPTWRITAIAWDANPLRHISGRRIRQKAVVSVSEYTPIEVVERSATQRSRSRNTQKNKNKHR
jgi:hypothetical protein